MASMRLQVKKQCVARAGKLKRPIKPPCCIKHPMLLHTVVFLHGPTIAIHPNNLNPKPLNPEISQTLKPNATHVVGLPLAPRRRLHPGVRPCQNKLRLGSRCRLFAFAFLLSANSGNQAANPCFISCVVHVELAARACSGGG